MIVSLFSVCYDKVDPILEIDLYTRIVSMCCDCVVDVLYTIEHDTEKREDSR